jgi:hypothetical protein
MSDATLQAVHDAIAAHIADVSDDDHLFLTEWHCTAAAAIPAHADRTMYFNIGTNAPYHHRLGLANRGLEMLVDGEDEGD